MPIDHGLSHIQNNVSLYVDDSKTLHLQGLEAAYTLYICDLHGKMMYSTNDVITGIATDLWPEGLYTVQVLPVQGKRIVAKFIR